MSVAQCPGAVFVCDGSGILREILEDSIGLIPEGYEGRPLSGIIGDGSIRKMFGMFDELNSKHVLYDWELNVRSGPIELETIHVAAAVAGARRVFVATPGMSDLQRKLREPGPLADQFKEAFARMRDAGVEQRQSPNRLDLIAEINNELVSVQRELINSNTELAISNRTKNELLGIVAHDLRGQLQNMNMACELLSFLTAETTPDAVRYLESLQQSVRMMTQLVDNTLDQSVIESGTLRLIPEDADVAAVTESLIELLQHSAQRKSSKLYLDIKRRPLLAHLDVARYGQIINNLVYNAIKYCPPGAEIRVSLDSDGSDIVLVIADNGPGLPADVKADLFRPFRGSSRGTAGEPGTGLGLAIVNKVVTAQGGTISSDSNPNHGAVFTVRLPRFAKGIES